MTAAARFPAGASASSLLIWHAGDIVALTDEREQAYSQSWIIGLLCTGPRFGQRVRIRVVQGDIIAPSNSTELAAEQARERRNLADFHRSTKGGSE